MTKFRDEFIRRNHALGRQCDRALGWILLLWALLFLASGYYMPPPMLLGWLPPVILWGIFRVARTWKQRCSHCRSRWILERIPAVIASGRCPNCQTVLWEITDAPSGATSPPPPKVQKRIVFLLGAAALLFGIFWSNFGSVFSGLLRLSVRVSGNLQTLVIFCAPSLVLLFCWMVYCLTLRLAEKPRCPLCRESWSRRDQSLFQTFGNCPHCGRRIADPAVYAADRPDFALTEESGSPNWTIITPDGICIRKAKHRNLLPIERHITFYGLVIIAAYACYVIIQDEIGHICAGMTPSEGPEPYRRNFWFISITFLLPTGLLFFWEWCKYYFFSRCAHCGKYLDRDIVALTGHCGHCGEKYAPPATSAGKKL